MLPSAGARGEAWWEHFPHGADIGVRGWGPDLADAFEQAALALTAAITDLERVKPEVAVEVECAAPDRELLLVEWLNAVIYEMAVRRMLFSRFAVTIQGEQLAGRLWGERVDRRRHRPAAEPKGATLTALDVRELAGGGWVAQCVVDV
jgi:tRNA nucleotidyltransferase (CCA-adding enzyme)